MIIRKLEANDYHRGYLNLLKQLTFVSDHGISYEEFKEHLENKVNSEIYVIIDGNDLIGSGTLLIEKKFVHNLKSVGHIEDLVIDDRYRNRGFGKILVDHLILQSKMNNCYKIILDCNLDKIEFYKKCDFKNKSAGMSLYFQ